ncbi:MAG: hypothetical protein WBG90_07780 [Saonia sp.]
MLDENRILAVIDSVGNKTYSVRMYVPDTPYNIFYNVIAKVTADGKQREPMVLCYEVDKDYYHTYITTSRPDARFKGTIKMYALDNFIEGSPILGKTIEEPCIEAHADGSSGGRGGGSSGGGTHGGDYDGTGFDPGSYYSYWVLYASDYGGGAGQGTQAFVEVGDGDFGPFGTDGTFKRSSVSKDGDCPEDRLLFPINEVVFWNEEAILEELGPDTPIEDLAEFLKCYDTSKPATITIYADQPKEGTAQPISTSGYVGHAFVSISQNGKTSTFGFYPKGRGPKAIGGPSIAGNDGSHIYDISISKTVTGTVLKNIINAATNMNDTYNLSSYNCTDYARELGNLAGMGIPNAWGLYPTIPASGGENPGKLGEVLRNMESGNGITIKKTGGTAQSKKSGC